MFGEAPAPRPGTSHPRPPSLAQSPTPSPPINAGARELSGIAGARRRRPTSLQLGR